MTEQPLGANLHTAFEEADFQVLAGRLSGRLTGSGDVYWYRMARRSPS